MGNNRTQKRNVQIISIITLFVFLVDIYLIIYVPTDYILITAAFATLVFTIITINSWLKLRDLENKRREEQYEDIMKAQKGTYVVTLEMLKDLDSKINFIGQKIMPLGKAGDENQRKIASMLDSIVQDQKKIAKITISRSKENADALMNSNDQLLVQMTAFRDAIEVIQEKIGNQASAGTHESGNFGEIKNELFEKMQELTDSIKKEVDEISENIEVSNQSMEDLISVNKAEILKEAAAQNAGMVKPIEAVQEPIMAEEPAVAEAVQEPIMAEEPAVAEAVQEPMMAQEPVVAEAVQEPIIAQEPVIPETIEIDGNDVISELLMEKKSLDEAVLMEEPQKDESVAEPVVSDPNKPMSPDDIAALLASTEEQKNISDNANPAEDEKPSKPDMSDPNKPMSPEDIAALIANTATENLPEETVKFEDEEAPPMPDMSDPNKPMSPDDIAALIANL